MNRFAAVLAAFCALAMSSANPAQANEFDSLNARASAEYDRGIAARDAGRNTAACQYFRNAEVLYHNSIVALSGMGYGHRSDEDLQTIRNIADSQQSNVKASKARAGEVCGRVDSATLNGSAGGSSASDDGGSFAERERELQRTETLAKGQYRESIRLWEAGSRQSACATIRLSAANFGKVSAALKANPALRSAFANPDQIEANASLASEVRDDMFCKG